ncbi:monocarboxylate transporter [Thozetella sp. PMI_491]|nr:monocarboxylate transporter [Thozetella sp. PMI_491]
MSVELDTIYPARQRRDVGDEEETNSLVQTLAPADTGDAWKLLAGAFVIEASLWGFLLAFGVFQEYYSKQPEFQDESNIAVIGTVSTSIYFLGAPFATPLVKRFQNWQHLMIVGGWALCVVSLVAASFATNITALIATQGFLYGLGFLTLYFPVLSMLNEWFVQRRGLAYGVMYAGGGLSGIGFPFLLEALLSKFGFRTTLRAVAVAQFVLVAPILPLMKGRLPPSSHGTLRMFDLSFLSQPLFYCLAISNLFQGFAFFIPSLYLPSFASALGLSGTMGALLLAVINLATVFGQISFGWLSDRTNNVVLLVFVSSFVSAVATFTLWGFATSIQTLIAYSLIYGWFGGAFVILWTKFGSVLSDDPRSVFSMMAFGRGIGNIALGPISSFLVTGLATSGYGLGKFEPLILYVGSLMLCSSMGIFGWSLKRRR